MTISHQLSSQILLCLNNLAGQQYKLQMETMLCVCLPSEGILVCYSFSLWGWFFTLYLYSFAVECPSVSPLNLTNMTSSSNMIKSKRLSKQNKHWPNICLQVWTYPGTCTEMNTSISVVPIRVNEHNSLDFSKPLPVYASSGSRSRSATMASGATKQNSCMQKRMNWYFSLAGPTLSD